MGVQLRDVPRGEAAPRCEPDASDHMLHARYARKRAAEGYVDIQQRKVRRITPTRLSDSEALLPDPLLTSAANCKAEPRLERVLCFAGLRQEADTLTACSSPLAVAAAA